MHWILALLGAFFGYAIGDASAELLGLVLGAFAGWQGARLIELRQRLAKLEREQSLAAAARQPASPTLPPTAMPGTAQAPATAAPASATTAPERAAAAPRPVTRPEDLVAKPARPAAAASAARAPAPKSIPDAATAVPKDGLEVKITAFLRRAFLEGNVPVKIGALLLFFGVAAALKYAADQGYFSLPIEFRLAGFAALAVGALLWGWRNRQKQPAFGLSLQGLGIGLLLMVVFAAFAYYHLLPTGLAFALVLLIVATAALLAVLQNAIWLAALGFVGGYLAPVLINTGSGNHVALFSYYALLNAAVFFIAWKTGYAGPIRNGGMTSQTRSSRSAQRSEGRPPLQGAGVGSGGFEASPQQAENEQRGRIPDARLGAPSTHRTVGPLSSTPLDSDVGKAVTLSRNGHAYPGWRLLNLIGFAFTFVIGGIWGWQHYAPDKFATVEPFLILFFAFYTLIPVLHALRQPEKNRGIVDATLVFGTPLLAFPLQAALLADDRYGLAVSAIAMATLYVLLAWWLVRRRQLVNLGTSFAVLGGGFATLAVPLALSANWTAATWALEGAALVWLGQRQNHLLPRLTGLLLQVIAAGAYAFAVADGLWDANAGELPLLNGHALTVLCLAAAAGFVGWSYDRHRPMPWLSVLALIGALFWWSVFGTREITGFRGLLPGWFGRPVALWPLWIAAGVALLTTLRSWLPWYRLGYALLPLIALIPLFAVLGYDQHRGLLGIGGLIAWPLLFLTLAWSLHRFRQPQAHGISWMHVGALWSLAIVLGLALLQWSERVESLGSGWSWLLLVLPLAALLFGNAGRPARLAWPLSDLFDGYRRRWLIPAAAVLGLGWLLSLFSAGDSTPLPFLPLLNPLELMQLGLLLFATAFALRNTRLNSDSRLRSMAGIALPLAAFAFVTMACLRGVHHLRQVAWSERLLQDNVAQTSLTVVWSIIGVLAWVIGSRRKRWSVWLLGAILMGVVLVKLGLVDRHYLGNITGIVSMMVVGGLLVLVGKLAPTPPRDAASGETEGDAA